MGGGVKEINAPAETRKSPAGDFSPRGQGPRTATAGPVARRFLPN